MMVFVDRSKCSYFMHQSMNKRINRRMYCNQTKNIENIFQESFLKRKKWCNQCIK